MNQDCFFECPYCEQMISEGDKLVMTMTNRNDQVANVKLHTNRGISGFSCDKSIEIHKGEYVRFSCPKCKKDLRSELYPYSIKINLRITGLTRFDILFSAIYGNPASHIIIDGELLELFDNDYRDLMLKRKAG